MTTPQNDQLDLTTAVEPTRPTIRIDGQRFEMAVRQDFVLGDMKRLAQMGRDIAALDRLADLSDEEVSRAEASLDGLVALLVRGLPKKLVQKLSLTQKFEIVQLFPTLLSRGALPPTPAEGSLSPGSNGSTGEALSTG